MFSLNEYMLRSFQISVTLNFSRFLQTIQKLQFKIVIGPINLQPLFKREVEKWFEKSGSRNLVRKKWFFKLGFFFLAQEKWLTRNKGGSML